ncbi:unnamed protein product [Ambrosiozyma monospora]|uniref:Unnamed protein product n=1 Tax=Ambrosiozyma monospora TaxID=43982 RepID=A0ACB5T224_AMBMO|nr:unnamed protein product [Ambrosiozyma monospora]
MGAELSLLVPTAQTIAVSAYIDSLKDVQYTVPLGTSRFLKTVKCVDKSGSVVVKVLIKPGSSSSNNNGNDDDGFKLEYWVTKLDKLRQELIGIPNVLPFESIIDSQRAGYLIRPYVRYNLYDRVSVRPFLEPIEKKWIVYQLLSSMAKLHAKGIYHGDLKTENVLLTSWNWCLISDFAMFKPVFLPEGNPSLFSFYFDTSQRHVCYVAPERFVASDDAEVEELNKTNGELNWQMDIFSLGCVIAELYLESLPIFTLPQI